MNWIIAVLILLFPISCGGGKSRKNNSNSQPPPSVVTPDNPPVEQIPVEEGPPINPDEVKTITESTTPKILRLNFAASDAQQENRYLSEYLLVLKATENTCIRLKMRPGAGLESSVLSDILKSSKKEGESESFSCTPKTEEKTEETTDESTPDETPDSTATALKLGLHQYPLMAATEAALCSQKLFRMPISAQKRVGENTGLEEVVSKTGYLVAKSDHLRLWVDAEVGNPCSSGTPASFSSVRMILGNLLPLIYRDSYDRLGMEHYENMVSEGEKIFLSLTSTYGAMSDVDANGKVEIFVSPEVNRKNMSEYLTEIHDNFQVDPIYKPEDLAAYDETLNPTSNESEVLYSWAPDPGGLYKYSIYPTSNSLVSNYLRGFLAQQMMTNIIINSHLILRQGPAEEKWLVMGLSLLASAYMAGNDYSLPYLAEYFSTRHQNLSLTNEEVVEQIPKNFQKRLGQGRYGYQALFAWYLHTAKCGTSVAPCAELKKLVDTALIGFANVEAFLASTRGQIMEHFGSSVGVEMADEPEKARTIWTTAKLANPPYDLAPLQEVNSASPPQTYEQNKSAQHVTTDNTDRTVAGPIPSLHNLLFQPILPDNDLQLTLQKNSVTYLLLTGLIEKNSEMSTYVGSNLGITLVALGEQNVAKRQIHMEKSSENAHLDQRPTNLTGDQDDDQTYYDAPAHTADYEVKQNKELWIMGSLDNFTVNKTGDGSATLTEVQDVDTYNISVDPCAGDADESGCRSAGGTRSVLVQAIPRDFPKEFEPLLLVSTPNIDMYRGRIFAAKMDALVSGFIMDEKDSNKIGIICQSEALYQTNPSSPDFSTFSNCSNGGLTKSLFKTEVCDAFPGSCDSAQQQSISFDAYTYRYYQKKNSADTYVGPLYDNFFHAGPQRFPFQTNYTIYYPETEDKRVGVRPYIEEEIFRQFFTFAYKADLKPLQYYFFPVFAGSATAPVEPDLTKAWTNLDETTITVLVKLKQYIADQIAVPDLATLSSDCEGIGISSDICANPYSNRVALQEEVLTLLEDSNIVCSVNSFANITSQAQLDALCAGRSLTTTGTVNGQPSQTTSIWLPANRFVIRSTFPISYNLKTFYQPVYPDMELANSFCKGREAAKVDGMCPLVSGSYASGDLRYQLNVPSTSFTHTCSDEEIGNDFIVCTDRYGFLQETTSEGYEWADYFHTEVQATDRDWEFGLPLGKRAGEIIGKPSILPYIVFQVPVAHASTFQLMIGARKMGQGKYLLRVRTDE